SPEFLVLFSSISAFAGIAGQADYAAANAFLDGYAEARRDDPLTQVVSIGWSQWGEVGMAATLNAAPAPAALPENLGAGEALDHPFLDRLHRLSADEYVATATLTPERHWVLDEHRIAGAGPVLPGTAYLELARAVHAAVQPGPMALSDVAFLAPFACPDGALRELRVHLRRRADAWRWSVLGRAVSGAWTEHASGTAAAQPIMDVAALDLLALAQRCSVTSNDRPEDDPVVRFGPRWASVTHLGLGEREALLELAMAPAYHAEFAVVSLHPALLDFATAGAQELVPGRRKGRDFFAPFSYRRLALHAALPPAIVSHVRLRPSGDPASPIAVFDVTLSDPQGRVLAEIDEFTMLRVSDPSVLALAPPAMATEPIPQANPVDDDLAPITPAEGLEAIERLLAGPMQPHVVISPYRIGPLLRHLRQPPRAAHGVLTSGEHTAADLPATEIEAVIAGLWSDLLGVGSVGRHDNFFDLGGHSLLAVQFTNRLRKKTGRTLPLAALLETPTVARLAAVIDPEGSAAAEAGDNAADTIGLPAARRIVTIRAGGSLTPIFFVHDGLGETLLYRGLAVRLDPDRPVYGIEPLRSPSGNYGHTRIDEMAADYITLLRTVQPLGPYFLAGLCAGGVIAFEMARQLQDLGERVAFVGIIDAADVAAAKRPHHIARGRVARLRASLRGTGPLAVLPMMARKAANTVAWEIRSRMDRARDRQVIAALQADQSGRDTVQAEPSISFLRLYEAAHREHQPHGLFEGGSVALFKAADADAVGDDVPYQFIYGDRALGWGGRVAEEMTILDVPGGHSSALQEPHVAVLARFFQQAIDKAGDPLQADAGYDVEDHDVEDYGAMAVAAE
ncbi:MAG: thioesterase domain-containing protein, partial [Novosphingobium sp.]